MCALLRLIHRLCGRDDKRSIRRSRPCPVTGGSSVSNVNRRDVIRAAAGAGAAVLVSHTAAPAAAQSGEKRLWEGHQTIDPKQIQDAYTGGKTGATERFRAEHESAIGTKSLRVGLKREAFRGPRPDLNGYRVVLPAGGAVYLIDEGYRRWIPDPETYNNLFRNWDGIVRDINIVDIPEASPLSHGAVLAVPVGGGAVYLVSNGQKRWITSPAAMDKYWFNWDRIRETPQAILDGIPEGRSIS